MQTNNIEQFLKYFESIRGRTLRVFTVIPADKLEWTYKEGKFTFGDIIRHLGAIERFMFAENAMLRPSRYPGHDKSLSAGYTSDVAYLDAMHQEAVEIFKALSDEDLSKKCFTPAGNPITIWKWLRAMIEHEVHHRGQIYMMLGLLGVESPPLYGLTSEQVREKSQE